MIALESPVNPAEFFERLHRAEPEPWSFSERAAEVIRHQWITTMVNQFAPSRLLDVGCSLGQLTECLVRPRRELHAIDVSPTALARARTRMPSARVIFHGASATDLPLAPRSFDFAVASDGLYSWNLGEEDRSAALRELHRVLRPGGHIVLTEHTRREKFGAFVREIERSPLRVLSVSYLYDRPWYQVESWFKAVQQSRLARALRRNLTFARLLQLGGRIFGPAASRHVCVLAVRDG